MSSLALLAPLACGGGGETSASGGGAGAPEPAASAPGPASSAVSPAAPASSSLGEGLVVWESNRGGPWRIWTRPLDGSEPRQLSPNEPGRQHCCPHVSPDGRRVAYLSVAGQVREYRPEGLTGALHLIDADGRGDRVLVAEARNHFENRAVVWRGPEELIYIAPGGQPVLLDLATGASEVLAREVPDQQGWLINAALSHASSGSPSFAAYDRERRRIVPRTTLGGCQPFFSGDGRWGYWTAGAGGPLNRIDLGSRRISTIIERADPRIPDGFGYLYFPMFSHDGLLFAFAASTGEHDHFRSDYEVFVAESDPGTLELIGPPVRITRDPATDRYPDVYLAPLALGRHYGEAPFAVRLTPPGAAVSREWSFGDGGTARAAVGEHTWERPGIYAVEARSGGDLLRGRVVVREARPPRPLAAAAAENGQEVVVRFDEPIALDGAEVAFESGRRIAGRRLGEDQASLHLELADRLTGPDRLRLAGIADRAQRPNRLPATTLEVEPPLWPSRTDGLVFLWETADAPNLVPDPAGGPDRAWTLKATGLARLDHAFAMRLGGGAFYAEAEQAAPIRYRLQGKNQITLELTLQPEPGGAGRRQVVALSDHRLQDFSLWQVGDRLVFSLRVGNRGPEANPEAEVARLPAGRRGHLVIAFTPGRLTAYLDGEQTLDSDLFQGDFFHWRNMPLVFGDRWGGKADWAGTVEGVAIYDRVLGPEEVRENHLRYRTKLERRPAVPRVAVEARLLAASPPPTLREITPYREALAVAEYEVLRVIDGSYAKPRVRVARWVILDGQTLAAPAAGERRRLILEPFADNRQLESVFLSATLPASPLPLYYAVDDHPAAP